jgi:hypothetical protein
LLHERADVLTHLTLRARVSTNRSSTKGDESPAIAVKGSLTLDDLDLVIQAAVDRAGLAWPPKTESRNTLRTERSSACWRLVPAVPRFLPLLSQSPTATGCSLGAD